MPKSKLKTGLKYKIYQAVWGLIKELKIEPQKLSQLPAIHWQRRCNNICCIFFQPEFTVSFDS